MVDPKRRTELTEDELEQFLDLFENGSPIAQAASMVGISRRTIHKWIEEGKTDDGRSDRKAFASRVDEIRASFKRLSKTEAEMILEQKALEGNVPALKYFLERRDRDAASKAEQDAKPKTMVDQLAEMRKRKHG